MLHGRVISWMLGAIGLILAAVVGRHHLLRPQDVSYLSAAQ